MDELKKKRSGNINIVYPEGVRDTTFSFYIGKQLGIGEGGLALVYVKHADKYQLKNVQGAGGNFYYDEFPKSRQ